MAGEKRRRVLEPTERFSEILFGLIMVLTFTGSLSAASSGRSEVRTMLIGAIGCNLAWGIVDAIMYLLNLARRRGEPRTPGPFDAWRRRASRKTPRSLIADACRRPSRASCAPTSFEPMRRRLDRPPEPARARPAPSRRLPRRSRRLSSRLSFDVSRRDSVPADAATPSGPCESPTQSRSACCSSAATQLGKVLRLPPLA